MAKTMKVLCIEGCHGVGKSSLLANLQQHFVVLDEMFTDMPSYDYISSQSLPMEFIWVANWFNRLLSVYENDYHPVVFADRSPYSAVYYSKTSPVIQESLKNLIRAMTDELAQKNIILETVCVTVKKEILWERIQRRLEREPFRAKYNEGSYEWMEQTWDFFDKFPWDYVIDNSAEIQGELGDHLINKLDKIGACIAVVQ